MLQTVTIEQTIAATQTLTLKLNDYRSNENPNPNPDNVESKSPVDATTDPKPEPDHAPIPIPIPDVGLEVIEAVKEFLKKQESSDDEVRAEATNELNGFIERENVTIETLLVLAKYAYDLNNADLLGVFCQRVADSIKDKKVEEVREIFGIENDFTPEEEQAMRDEYAWAFED